ncbi:MAG: SRPBCC family protein [Ignavibacteriales bacterium]|nr:SRPBCC family protein [Ignavibacteriales bacterium]
MEISIDTTVKAAIEQVWSAWVTPDDIKKWNFASDDWCCPDAKIDLKVGGKFNSRMEAKDGSMGFNFEGTFTSIVSNSIIEYVLDDNRKVRVSFSETENGIKVVETFETEDENSAELQRQGWKCILSNFKKYVEAK